MATSLEPLKGGYDVDENAIRFSNYFHVLRELVHLSFGWLPLTSTRAPCAARQLAVV